jgi:hypothetical protein
MNSPVPQFRIRHNLYATDAQTFNYDGASKSKKGRSICVQSDQQSKTSHVTSLFTQSKIVKPFGNISPFLSTFLLGPSLVCTIES